MRENPLIGMKNRILHALARMGPGSTSLRVWLHRARGVTIGEGAFIGTDTIIETSKPWLVSIGDDVSISMRVTIIAHFHEMTKVRIEDQAFIGPGAVILPANPGFYAGPQTIRDLVDTVVARVLDHLALPQKLVPRWAEEGE